MLYSKKECPALQSVLIACYLLYRVSKPKTDFIRISGKVAVLSSQPGDDISRFNPKKRFLQLDNSTRIFELFIGKERGDFAPEYEIIDSLKVGDQIDLFYDDNYQTQSFRVNRLTQYIDRAGLPVFIKGNADRVIGIFIIVTSVIAIIILYLLRRTGKIA